MEEGKILVSTAEEFINYMTLGMDIDTLHLVKEEEVKRVIEILSTQKDDDYPYYLAQCYFKGFGVIQDQNKGLQLIEKAAILGNVKATNDLGIFYERGFLKQKDVNMAFELYKKAALHEDIHALKNVANCYHLGLGVQKDINKAIMLYKHLFKLGEINEICKAGYCYEEINNDDLAFKSFYKGALENDMEAEYNVGLYYYRGRSVEKSVETSIYWFKKSADNGYKLAYDKLVDIDNKNKQQAERPVIIVNGIKQNTVKPVVEENNNNISNKNDNATLQQIDGLIN